MKRRSEAAAVLLCAGVGLGACGEPAPDAAGAAGRISAGGRTTYATASHTCAVSFPRATNRAGSSSGGALRCWGAADRGQTGDGSLAPSLSTPTQVAGLPPVRAVAAGGGHTCASSGDAVHCFGDNAHAQGGVDRPFLLLEPTTVPGLPVPVTALAAGLDHTCAIAGGAVWCWGRNEAGESGRPPEPDCRAPFRMRRCSVAPSRVDGIDGAVALALGGRHGCAIAGGRARCWGANDAGQLGDGTRTPRGRPEPVADLPGAASAIAAGARHSCALMSGEVFCWGAGRTRPVRWSEPDQTGLSLLAAGGDRTCTAIRQRVWCGAADGTPRAVAGVPPYVSGLAVSPDHACALLASGDPATGDVHCWGENDFGQLGTGDAVGRDPWPPWDGLAIRDRDGDGRIKLVCLGDSNTAPMAGADASWCDRLGEALPGVFEIVNRGLGGATASEEASLLAAATPVQYAIEHDAPEVAVLAYGTNDLLHDTPVPVVAGALSELAARLRTAGTATLVALVPPVRSDDVETNRAVAALNDALRDAFPPEQRIDFASGFGDAQLLDRVHLGGAGQALRAERAAEAVTRLLRAEDAP